MKIHWTTPKRILMTADPIGGVWSYAVEMARQFERSGTELILMTMGAPLTRNQRSEMACLRQATLVETDYRLEWMDDPWNDVDQAGEKLLELESRFDPEIVHLNGFAHGALPWRHPVMIVAHSCALSWWRAVHGEDAPAKYQLYRERVAQGLHRVGLGTPRGLVVAPTWDMLASLQENYGYTGRSRVIPNGQTASPPPAGIKEPIILSAGRLWDEAKNFSMLDRAASGLSWPVFVAGDPTHPNGEQRNFQNLNHLGALSRNELLRHLGAASIYALPALYEPFGLSILEAALAGCALLLGDIPSLRELWQDAALFVSPHDEGAIRAGIKALIRSPELLTEMGLRAQTRSHRYTPAAMMAGYQAAYHELMDSQTPLEVAS